MLTRKALIYLLFTTILSASSYQQSSNCCILPKTTSTQITKNRIEDYTKKIDSLKKLTKHKQLLKVNLYLNQLMTKHDYIIQKKKNHWATPKEFLTTGYGDCEDYAIIKYFTLLKLGFDKNKLFLTVVDIDSVCFNNEKADIIYSCSHHMVLSYFETLNRPPLILDNISFKILDLKNRNNLKAVTFTNSTGVYAINKDYTLKKIANRSLQFENLLKRVEAE